MKPTRALERQLRAAGHDVVVGIDEVGRGSWAGPLVVGAAVLPWDTDLDGVRDSKAIAEARRERVFDDVAAWCRWWAVGAASDAECDRLGMSGAQQLAAARALDALGVRADVAVVDGRWDFVGDRADRVVLQVKADRDCTCVAAASILAKVSRDRWMRDAARHYPLWDFEANKGYPSPAHRTALLAHGPSAIHRRSWVFMDHYVPYTGVTRRRGPG